MLWTWPLTHFIVTWRYPHTCWNFLVHSLKLGLGNGREIYYHLPVAHACVFVLGFLLWGQGASQILGHSIVHKYFNQFLWLHYRDFQGYLRVAFANYLLENYIIAEENCIDGLSQNPQAQQLHVSLNSTSMWPLRSIAHNSLLKCSCSFELSSYLTYAQLLRAIDHTLDDWELDVMKWLNTVLENI